MIRATLVGDAISGFFLLFSAVGGAIWASYTCLLAYWIGTTLADFPLASILISGVATTVLIGAVYLIDRRRHTSETEPPTTPDAAARAASDAGARRSVEVEEV